jgi:hypothetical protein
MCITKRKKKDRRITNYGRIQRNSYKGLNKDGRINVFTDGNYILLTNKS